MPIITLIAALMVGPLQQGAPADVPKSHWAHDAVDTLFKEGLLKGYPSGQSPQLRLDKKAPMTLEKGLKIIRHWKDEGLLTGYPEMHHSRNEPSRYEAAVAIHTVWANVRGYLQEGTASAETLQGCRNEMPALVQAISGFHSELTRLGADTQEMVNALNDLRDGANRPFHGSPSS